MRAPRAAGQPLLVVLALGILFAFAPARADEAADTSLAATTAPPWNPPRAMSPNEPWEAVVRFPGRVVSLPIAAIGQGTRRGLLAAEQGFYVQRFLYFFRGVKVPFMIGPAGLGDRTGLGAGVGIAPRFGPVTFDALFDASLAEYTRTRFRLRSKPAYAEWRIDKRPAERFFGFGMGGDEEEFVRYGLEEQRVTAGLQATRDLPLAGKGTLLVWGGPRYSRVTQGFGNDETSIAKDYPAVVAGSLDQEIEHLTYGAEIQFDRRQGRPHWTHGFRAGFGAERYDVPFASSPTRTGAQFTRYTLLAETGFSFMRDPRTVRLTLRAVDQEISGTPGRFLVSDLARMGGSAGLAGYEPQRFQSLDALNLRAAYVFPLAQHFEFDLHGDAGGVFADLQEDLKPNLLRQSLGFGLRGRTAQSVIVTIGCDFSSEAARFVFSIGGEE